MANLTDREKKTIRLAAMGVALYLVLFFGLRGWKHLETRRLEYQRLVEQAERLRREFQPYENKALLVQKLRGTFNLDPRKLTKATLVAEVSAAIQKAATSGGVQLGPMRESPARAAAKELVSMQLEGSGPIPAMMALVHRLEGLGFPLVIDSIQITPDNTRPSMIKISMTIVILDWEQWKAAEASHA